MANVLTSAKRVQVAKCLVEGCSIRSTVRLTGVAKNTVAKLLRDLGEACEHYQFRALRNIPAKRVQVDEIWSFVYAKEKNVPEEMRGNLGVGDCWTWTAIDADTKLAICWLVGERDGNHANQFIADLACRLTDRIQLSSDGLTMYRKAVAKGFSNDVDFAQIIKVFGVIASEAPGGRYSPPMVTSIRKDAYIGNPDMAHVSTSFVERQNLSMRMSMRRFTRLTNAFSKKIENHAAAIALHFAYYNFCRIHKTLRVNPAMAAGVTDRLWEVSDLLTLLDGAKASDVA